MAIYLDSRYADGPVFKAWDSRKNEYHLTVLPTMTVTKVAVPLPPNNVEWRDLILWHEAENFLVRKWERRT